MTAVQCGVHAMRAIIDEALAGKELPRPARPDEITIVCGGDLCDAAEASDLGVRVRRADGMNDGEWRLEVQYKAEPA